jgi:hypothetical protein
MNTHRAIFCFALASTACASGGDEGDPIAGSTGAATASTQPGGEGSANATTGTSGPADGSESSGSTGPQVEFDEDAALAEALGFREDFTVINAELSPSEHTLGEMVEVYSNELGLARYTELDPSSPTMVDPFPAGTILVKAHYDGDEAFTGTTIMIKGPAGYAPEGNDWFWAMANASDAVQMRGQIDFCIACHRANATLTDLVFGVPLDNRGE